MFRDTKEELRRLEAQLLEEEDQPEDIREEPEEDPEDEPEEVPEQKGLSTLATVVFMLLCGILLVLGVFLLRAGGYL